MPGDFAAASVRAAIATSIAASRFYDGERLRRRLMVGPTKRHKMPVMGGVDADRRNAAAEGSGGEGDHSSSFHNVSSTISHFDIT